MISSFQHVGVGGQALPPAQRERPISRAGESAPQLAPDGAPLVLRAVSHKPRWSPATEPKTSRLSGRPVMPAAASAVFSPRSFCLEIATLPDHEGHDARLCVFGRIQCPPEKGEIISALRDLNRMWR